MSPSLTLYEFPSWNLIPIVNVFKLIIAVFNYDKLFIANIFTKATFWSSLIEFYFEVMRKNSKILICRDLRCSCFTIFCSLGLDSNFRQCLLDGNWIKIWYMGHIYTIWCIPSKITTSTIRVPEYSWNGPYNMGHIMCVIVSVFGDS